MPRKNHDLVTRLVPAILLAVLLQVHPAVAEVRVAGQPDAVSVEVRDAAVEEVLVALGQSFGLQYRSAAPLARRISGTYILQGAAIAGAAPRAGRLRFHPQDRLRKPRSRGDRRAGCRWAADCGRCIAVACDPGAHPAAAS